VNVNPVIPVKVELVERPDAEEADRLVKELSACI
jgi:hypothetical protein